MESGIEHGLMVFWYVIIIAAATCYAMLDGFDLGVGALHLFARKDEERRIFLNAIGPVWDGNEVWLVVTFGALFAGFPLVYATLLTAFYIPVMLLLSALIFRAVAIEFRSKKNSRLWRSTWDFCFFAGSVSIALGLGIVLGNLVQGLPLGENYVYEGGIILTFLRPFPILVGILTLSLFMMHGAIFVMMKTEGELQEKIKKWITPTTVFFIITYVTTTMVTLIYHPHMTDTIRARPYLFLVAIADMLMIANIFREVHKKNYGWAFISSCLNVALLLVLFAIGTFPAIIRSTIAPQNSITLSNATVGFQSLVVLTVIAGIGLPLVFAYSIYVYKIFRGKVELDHTSY